MQCSGKAWYLVRGWLLFDARGIEEPEVIVAGALEATREVLTAAKERAIRAIVERNRLRALLHEGKSGTEQSSLEAQLAEAEQAAEALKQEIRSAERRIHRRIAARLALSTRRTGYRVREQLDEALAGVSLEEHDRANARAEQRIRELQAKADARIDLAWGGMQQKMAKLENVVASEKADAQLAAMKAEMGMLPATVQEDPEDPNDPGWGPDYARTA